ncbi:MAG: hypothetical protein RQ824_00625 [bacterium]|nr:hypothetical protein [bacterium]
MSIVKKTLLMFGASLALFFIFAFIDEYENLFGAGKDNLLITVDPYEIEETLNRYIEKLSAAYLHASSDAIKEIPQTDDLRKELEEDIMFLERDGRIQHYQVRSLWLQNVNQVAADKVRASTSELISVRYLDSSDSSELRSLPEAVFNMSYVLEYGKKGWVVSRYDVVNIAASSKEGQ